MELEKVRLGQWITYNGISYQIVEVEEFYVSIAARGFKTVFKIGNEHVRFFTRK